jgi:hypothetical protein
MAPPDAAAGNMSGERAHEDGGGRRAATVGLWVAAADGAIATGPAPISPYAAGESKTTGTFAGVCAAGAKDTWAGAGQPAVGAPAPKGAGTAAVKEMRVGMEGPGSVNGAAWLLGASNPAAEAVCKGDGAVLTPALAPAAIAVALEREADALPRRCECNWWRPTGPGAPAAIAPDAPAPAKP